MRCASFIFVLSLMAGCIMDRAPGVPLPASTPYDNNPKTRKAYLRAYRDGYKCALSGRHMVPDTFSSDPVATATEFGWFDGEMAAGAALDAEHERQKGLRDAKDK
jgi:hypothetical protein